MFLSWEPGVLLERDALDTKRCLRCCHASKEVLYHNDYNSKTYLHPPEDVVTYQLGRNPRRAQTVHVKL